MIPSFNLSETDLLHLIDGVTGIGRWLLDEQKKSHQIDLKSNHTPVTGADLEADKRLRELLGGMTPSIPVLSEEGEIPDYSVRSGWKHFWLVDPLDGTKEFIAGRPDFTVNVALISAGNPVFGVVHAPGFDELYWGSSDGTFLKKNGSVRRVFSREPPDRGSSVVILESRSHPSAELERYLSQFRVVGRVQLGSSLKICRIACGEADLYPRLAPTMEWDTAAGDAVYRFSGESGVRYSPLIYNKVHLQNPHFVIGAGPKEQP